MKRAQVWTPGLLLIITVAVWMIGGSTLTADELCRGFDRESRVTRLDGGHAIVEGALKSRDDLTEFGREYAETLRSLLADRGLEAATDGVLKAIESGPVGEIDLDPGTKLDWMAMRKNGVVEAFSPVCFDTKQTYRAWRFEVVADSATKTTTYTFVMPKVCGNLALEATRTVVKPPIPAPTVALAVSRNCEAGTIAVSVDGSAPGTSVVIMSPEGVGHPIDPGVIEDPAPFTGALTFLAVAENRARDGSLQRTEKKETVALCPAPAPACSVSVDRAEVFAGEPLTIDADGHWVEDGFALRILDGRDEEVQRLVPSPDLPYTTDLSKPGVYRVQGGATNEIGDTAGCEAEVVVRPRWKLRPKAVLIAPTNRKTDFLAGVQGFDTDFGLGLDLEYQASPLIGLEIGVVGGQVDGLRRISPEPKRNDSLQTTMAHAALNFHFVGRTGVDFYLGPVVALVDVDDGSFGSAGDWKGGSDTALGGQIGLEIPLGPATRWSLSTGLRYLTASFDDDPMTGAVKMNPFVVGLGLTYGF